MPMLLAVIAILTMLKFELSTAQDSGDLRNTFEWLRQVAPFADGDEVKLYNSCRPMGLIVDVVDGGKIGLSEERVRNAVEGRLRASRLYTDNYGKSKGAYLARIIHHANIK